MLVSNSLRQRQMRGQSRGPEYQSYLAQGTTKRSADNDVRRLTGMQRLARRLNSDREFRQIRANGQYCDACNELRHTQPQSDFDGTANSRFCPKP